MAAISDAQGGTNSTTTGQPTTATVLDPTAEDGQDVPVVASQDSDDDHEDDSSELGVLP